jgi:molecular chaperone HtpG
MNLEYPELFEQCLAKNLKMRSAVDGTVVQFGSWLKDSKLPFFTDYTDHGTDHLNRVMMTAAGLIPAAARGKISAEDAAILIGAILLHDSALHLSEAGFYSLIKGKAASNRIEGFDKVAWPNLWDEYLFSAKRWDDQKLQEVLGVDENGAFRGIPRDPFDSYQNLTDTDRKFIGEFIRRHHPRLAHEFAVFGVAGPDTSDWIKLSQGFDPSLCDLAGLVARSHGRPIRVCLDYLASKSIPLREFQNTHAAFLMALIRLADYLHVEADRTSEVIFRYKHIPSRFSELEHKAHLAVKSVTRAVEDPEAVHVMAQPEDVETFLRLKRWLSGIQTELDQSWAVLGEVYGRYEAEGLSKLGLSLRRVRSNLDDVEKFASNVSYVPENITLDVARADLLKLLIGPLYGHDPGIGVRELVQNAVDAVRELRAFVGKHQQFKNIKTLRQTAEVELQLKPPDGTGISWLIVSDKGIGMTEEVVRDYFLKAGASFRNSDTWKREFESDQQDRGPESTKSRVMRSGRFGVGALGTFLLGDEVHVSTRHITASKGFGFTTRLDLAPIELRYDDSLNVGTSVSIKLRPEVYDRLQDNDRYARYSWDWYCLADPQVRRVGPSKRRLEQQTVISRQDLEPNSKWRKISPAGYESVYWSYESAPPLICNGIRVGKPHSKKELCAENGYRLSMPNLCVFDPDGALPLNLQRDGLATDEYPFEDMLTEDVSRDFLAFLIVNVPCTSAYSEILGMPKYPGYSLGKFSSDFEVQPWVIVEEGICPFTTWNLWRLDFGSLLLRTRYRSGETFVFDPLKKVPGSMPAWLWFQLEGNARSKRSFLVEWLRDIRTQRLVEAYLTQGKRLITSSTFSEYFNKVTTYPDGIKRNLAKESDDGKYCSLATQGCPSTAVAIEALPPPPASDSFESAPPLLIELFLRKGVEPKQTIFERLWKENIEYPVIPFDLTERRVKLAKAYQTLRSHIEAHEANKANAKKSPESAPG